jgi:hypothetical protein
VESSLFFGSVEWPGNGATPRAPARGRAAPGHSLDTAREWGCHHAREVVDEGGSQLTAGVREGDVLAGKYRVDRVLGVGGMGVVVAARHLQLDTKVAIKFLLPAMLGSQEAVSRFAREARAAVRITNEHVARVFDVGTLETGAPYMVMEFLEGGDLAAWVQQRGAMPVEMAVDFVLQACIAVAEAHGLGIVHRDLKPANLFCLRRADGQLHIKVLDFGISKLTDLGGSGPPMSVTKTSAMMGSPLYMSPEQMQSSRDVDAQTDIWALGVVLYELVTGSVPFNGETLPEVCVKIATQQPPPTRVFRPDVPPGLEAAMVRCLEKDKRLRFRNVSELANALADFGPKRSRAAVDRIAGMVHAAGLVAGGLPMPPPPATATTGASHDSHGTISPVGGTTPGRTAPDMPGGKNARWPLALGAGVLAIGAAATLALVHKNGVSADSPSRAPVAAEALPPPTASVLPAAVAAPPASPVPDTAPSGDVRVHPDTPAPSPAPAKPASVHSAPPTPHPHALAPAAVPVPAATPAPAPPPAPAPAPPPAPAPTPTPTHHPAPNANPLDLPLQ